MPSSTPATPPPGAAAADGSVFPNSTEPVHHDESDINHTCVDTHNHNDGADNVDDVPTPSKQPRGSAKTASDAGKDDAAENVEPAGGRQLQFLLDDDAAYTALVRENKEKSKQLTNLRADPWRFAVAPIFVVLSISNAMQWIAFSPIYNEVTEYFHMTPVQVNFLATTYVIAYVAIVFLSCKLYEVTGIRNGVLVSAITNALGSLLKIIAIYAWPNAVLLFMAQAINSFTEVLTIATPPLIANRWFPENERMVANTIMSSALNFGCGIGVLIPTFFVGPDKMEQKHFASLFWFHVGLCLFILAMVIFFFPKKPRYSASFAADRQQSKEEERLRLLRGTIAGNRGKNGNKYNDSNNEGEELEDDPNSPITTYKRKQQNTHVALADAIDEDFNDRSSRRQSGDPDSLILDTETATSASSEREVEPVNVFSVLMDCFRQARHNCSFVLLMIAAAAELGLIWAFATVLPQVLMPYGISETISGWIGFLNLVLGTVVCPFMMPLVERFGRRYKFLLCTISVILLMNMILLTLLLHFGPKSANGSVKEDSNYYVVITFVCWGGVSGLCQNFMMPLMFEYVVELTFPMAESTSAPALTWAACLSNLILALIFGAVLDKEPTENESLRVFIGATVVTAIGSVALFFTKPMQKRRDYEQLKREEQQRLAMEIEELRSGIDGAITHNNADSIGEEGRTNVREAFSDVERQALN